MFKWARKPCAVCKADFGVHPKANTYNTRQLCVVCRKRAFTLKFKVYGNYGQILEDGGIYEKENENV